MKFRKLRFTNFKSFEGSHSFDFSRFSNGLLFLTGDNLIEPKLGANGVGKSSLWDALCWCLYGKTIRSLRASNVHSWNKGKNTSAFLEFDINGRIHILDRGWNPNRLVLDFKEVTQEVVDSFLDITFEEFQHSIVIGQFSTTFFDLPPTQKLSVLSDILSLEYWLDKSKESSQILTSVSKDIGLLELGLVKLTSQIEEKEGTLPELQEASDRFEKDKSEKLNSFKRKIEKDSKEKKSVEVELSKLEVTILSLTSELTDCENLLKISTEKFNEEREVRIKKDLERSDILTRTSLNRKEYKKLESMIETVCFNCKQVIEGDHIVDISLELDNVYSDLRKSLKAIEEELDICQHKIDNRDSCMKRDHKSSIDVSHKLNRVEESFRRWSGCREQIDWSVKSSKVSISDLESRENEFEVIILDTKGKISELKKILGTKNQELNDLNKDKIGVEYWVKGFKEIRLTLLKEALTSLDIEVNNNLIQLGLSDWSISFDIERVTKAGTLSKGFQVFINSPLSNGEVPWEAWSGGESQRLRLAGAMGLANLLLNRKGIQSNIEVWDEPSSYLSQSGISDMIEYLAQRAAENNKQIWLVDHRTLDFGDFQSTVIITKDEDGSHINY
jgi:DNA repair exonuclease SbcCD ATPase subunit